MFFHFFSFFLDRFLGRTRVFLFSICYKFSPQDQHGLCSVSSCRRGDEVWDCAGSAERRCPELIGYHDSKSFLPTSQSNLKLLSTKIKILGHVIFLGAKQLLYLLCLSVRTYVCMYNLHMTVYLPNAILFFFFGLEILLERCHHGLIND